MLNYENSFPAGSKNQLIAQRARLTQQPVSVGDIYIYPKDCLLGGATSGNSQRSLSTLFDDPMWSKMAASQAFGALSEKFIYPI